MVAFSGAVQSGYRYLETDLRMTSDGVLICIHDETIDRTTDGSGRVVDYDFAEITSFDAGFRHRTHDGHGFRGQAIRIPAFEEVVTSFPEARFIIDLKADGLAEALAGLINRHDLADRVVVGSFSDARLARFVEATDGRIPTSTGPAVARSWLLASRVGRGVPGSASALQLPVQIRGLRVVDRRLVDAAHSHGLQVHVWTVNDADEMRSLLDLGVDGIVTDRPDLLREVLIAREEWT